MKPSLVAAPEAVSGPERRRLPDAGRASSVVLFGSSFKTSSLEFREALSARLQRDSPRLPRIFAAREYAQLVTCNRIELFVATESPALTERAFGAWLSGTPGLGAGSVYVRRDLRAISHLFRVASGLDSMVVGEEQILSQVKGAGVSARTSKSSKGSLSALFDASVNVGKRVREGLSTGSESVSSVAIRFALGRLARPPRNVLLIGTGKTTRLAATQLDGARIFVATRRKSLPAFPRASLVTHREMKKVASRCELIISATKHSGYVMKKGDLDGKRRVILDLAFPRNVDPALNSGRTAVYNLEDLAKEFEVTARGRRAQRAEELVAAEAESFSRWLLASRQSSALSHVYQWAENTRKEETDAALRRLPNLSPRERKVVEAMSRRMVSKLLAPTTDFVKSSSPEFPQNQRLDLIGRIFEKGEK